MPPDESFREMPLRETPGEGSPQRRSSDITRAKHEEMGSDRNASPPEQLLPVKSTSINQSLKRGALSALRNQDGGGTPDIVLGSGSEVSLYTKRATDMLKNFEKYYGYQGIGTPPVPEHLSDMDDQSPSLTSDGASSRLPSVSNLQSQSERRFLLPSEADSASSEHGQDYQSEAPMVSSLNVSNVDLSFPLRPHPNQEQAFLAQLGQFDARMQGMPSDHPSSRIDEIQRENRDLEEQKSQIMERKSNLEKESEFMNSVYEEMDKYKTQFHKLAEKIDKYKNRIQEIEQDPYISDQQERVRREEEKISDRGVEYESLVKMLKGRLIPRPSDRPLDEQQLNRTSDRPLDEQKLNENLADPRKATDYLYSVLLHLNSKEQLIRRDLESIRAQLEPIQQQLDSNESELSRLID